jgi:hypothetical protein
MRHLLFILSILVTVGCSKNEGEVSLSSLEGAVWGNSCAPDMSTGSYDLLLQFSAGTYLVYNRFYSDSGCASLSHRATLNGTYSMSGQNIDLTTTTSSMTMLTAAQVTIANNTAYCGFTNWVINVAKDVTGLDCGDWSFNPAGMTFYDIWKVEGNFFYMGASDYTYDGLTPATRPITFSSSPYIKQ